MPSSITCSSRAVKGLQNVSVTGVLSTAAVSFVVVDDELFEPPPPQPARARAHRTANRAAAARDIESLLRQDFSLGTFTRAIHNARRGPSQLASVHEIW